MPTIHLEADQLLNAALQMPEEEFQRFVTKLFSLKARGRVATLPNREAELLAQINQGIAPAEARRVKELIAKRQACTITETELQTLIQLTDEAERLNVERLRNLLELAHLRGVTLDEIMDQHILA